MGSVDSKSFVPVSPVRSPAVPSVYQWYLSSHVPEPSADAVSVADSPGPTVDASGVMSGWATYAIRSLPS